MQYHHLFSASSIENFKKAQKEKSQHDQIWRPSGKHKYISGDLSQITLNLNKKSNHLNACHKLRVAGEYIPRISQNLVLCTYRQIYFGKIKKRFVLWLTKSTVDTLTLADASSPIAHQLISKLIKLIVLFSKTKIVGENVWTYHKKFLFSRVKLMALILTCLL